MADARTLLDLSGADMSPPSLSDAALLLIDLQNEYLQPPLQIMTAEKAIAATATLLTRARAAGSTIIHVAHKGRAGSLFDRDAYRGEIVTALTPDQGESVIEKALPNAFAGTGLDAELKAAGRRELIITGFMTHMCVSSTARAALDLGYRVTIDARCCGTRDLPDGRGGVVAADLLNDVALVELSDRFAVVTRDHDWS